MTRISGEWLRNAATQSVFAMLSEAGYQVFAVGGCVRNSLLNHPVADVDFATDAKPDRVIDLAKNAGLKPVPTGLDHGTVTVVSSKKGFEVTTFRKDVKTDGRRAVVAFSQNPAEDAHRRDFTMNAVYANSDGALFDPLAGIPDILAGRVRFIDDANARIREDYLRILRFFRFHAWFGDPEAGIDADALAACAANADGLSVLSAERIGGEMRKLLAAPDPAPSLAAMDHAGVLARILPGASSRHLAALVHLESIAGLTPDWPRRLALIGGEDADRTLRLSRVDQKRLRICRVNLAGSADIPTLAYQFGAQAALDADVMRSAMSGRELPGDLMQRANHAASQVFPVRATDLDPKLQGAEIGARLKELESRWISSGFTLNKKQLLA